MRPTSPPHASVPTAAVVELRQYTLHPRQRDVLIELFDREFVETQEAVGMTVIGQFRDLDDPDEILREILSLSHRVAVRLRADGYRARTITLKLRLPSFSTLTRSRTLPRPTDVGADVFQVARELYLRLPPGRRRFRLIGVGTSGLQPAGAEQIALVREGRWGVAEHAIDRIDRRFGQGSAFPAALLGRRRRPS